MTMRRSMLEVLSQPFMQRALIVGVIVGIVLAFLGVFVTLKKMSFFVDAVAHSSLAGIAIALLIGIDPILGAFIFALLVSVAIGYVKQNGNLALDTVIGIFFPTSFAVGILIIGLLQGYRPELISFLFGNILSVATDDLIYALIVSPIVLLATIYLYRRLMFSIVDEETAAVQGVPTKLLEMIFLASIGAMVVVSLKVFGIILVSALVIIPAAAAKNVAKSLNEMTAFAVLFSLLSVVSGLFSSYYLNVASGATIVIVAATFFLLTFIFKRLQGHS